MLKLLLTILSCSGLISAVPLQTVSQEIKTLLLTQQMTEKTLYHQARLISVKVISGNNWGSGVIVSRKGETYTVLTNRHVITPSDQHQIQTPDGRIYPASIQPNRNSQQDDLALLQFQSSQPYQVAVIVNSSTLNIGDVVYGVGFPFLKEDYPHQDQEFVLTKGQLSLMLTQPLLEGYKLGYTNDIRKGMSGGAILNSQGQVIGINGKHAYPLWGDPFIYADGSRPTPQLRKQMISMSWGIPSETFKPWLGQASLPKQTVPSPTPSQNRVKPPSHPPEYLW